MRASHLNPSHPSYRGFVQNDFTDFPTTPYFPDDVPSYHTFFRFIQKVRSLYVITGGCGPTAFCPDSQISRGEMSFYIISGVLNEFPYRPPATNQSQLGVCNGAR